MDTQSASSAIVFNPVQIAQLTETYLDKRRQAADQGGLEVGMPIYIKGLDATGRNDDRGLTPIIDGDVCTIIARPGHGKTSLMMRWARERVKEINRLTSEGDQDAERRVVVYVTYEQTVEALHSFHVAASNKALGLSVTKMAMGKITDAQWEGVTKSNIRRVAEPLWFIGHSIERKARRPVINIDMLTAALWEIEGYQGEEKFRVDSVFLDYLQRMPYGKAESKTIGISDNLDAIKNLALSIGTKFVVGCQAKRDVDERADPTPGMEDGQWTSNIEQTSDTVLSIVRPCKYKAEGESFNGVKVTGFQQMRIVGQKQKMGESNFDKWVDFDPRYNELNEAETKTMDLSKL
jgi:replicative DNA helicase